jgi:4-methylaminobutanoate oxidase (formaldehyde-forming)
LVAERERGLRRRLRAIVLEEPGAIASGSEPVRVDGVVAGRVTSGGFGYSLRKSIAYAYLAADVSIGTPVTVELFGEEVRGSVCKEPLFDPAGDRIGRR